MHVAMSLREVYSELILTYGPRKLGKLNTDRSPGHGDAEHDSVVIISSVSRRFWLHLLLLLRRQSSQLSSSLFVPSEVRIRRTRNTNNSRSAVCASPTNTYQTCALRTRGAGARYLVVFLDRRRLFSFFATSTWEEEKERAKRKGREKKKRSRSARASTDTLRASIKDDQRERKRDFFRERTGFQNLGTQISLSLSVFETEKKTRRVEKNTTRQEVSFSSSLSVHQQITPARTCNYHVPIPVPFLLYRP